MKGFVAIAGFAAFAAAAPQGFPPAYPSAASGSAMLPTGSISGLPAPAGTGCAASSGFPAPSGGSPMPSYFLAPSGGFLHARLYATGMPSGVAMPSGLPSSGFRLGALPTYLAKREPQMESDIATGSEFAIPTASISFPASGGAAMPTGLGGLGGSSISFPALGSGEPGIAAPTGLGGGLGSLGGSGSALPTGLGSGIGGLGDSGSGSGSALPTEFA